jgi:hypothetical protein
MTWVFGGHFERSEVVIATGQQMPVDVTLAAAQHDPFRAGIWPAEQHCGFVLIGMITIGWHWLLFGPLGACPLGQQMPVDVIWLATQHEPPAGT